MCDILMMKSSIQNELAELRQLVPGVKIYETVALSDVTFCSKVFINSVEQEQNITLARKFTL